nr:retrovirus-related Pol polyprotein from transposon TNT 1-94 [Tanacetum cinerariifolium]
MFINHEKYTLVIVDEYLRYTLVYFLKKKSQAPKMIMYFIRMVENQNDVKVKQIKTNNGTKFRNYELHRFCNDKEISQNFSSPYTPEQNGVAERNNRTLIEATRTMLNGSVLSKHFWTEKHVPKVSSPNKHEIPHTKDTEGPSDLINTEGIHEQNVQNDQMINQPTDTPSKNNIKGLGPITKPLVHDVTQSHIPNQASTSSHPAPQDRCLRDQQIELINIIGNLGEGMLTRSMAAKLTTASASECLFANFLSELEPKKDDRVISICQELYTRNLLKKYEISDSSSVKTLMALISKDIQTQTMLAVTWTEKALQASIIGMKSQHNDYDIHYKMVHIFFENTNAIALSNNLVIHSRTKHIDIRYHFIRDHILKGDIELHFILTEYQLADIFTKPLDEPTFTRLKAEIGMLNID